MEIIAEAVRALRQRGVQGDITEREVVDALRRLSVRPRTGPPEADDSDYLLPYVRSVPAPERARLGIETPTRARVLPPAARMRLGEVTDLGPVRRGGRAMGPAHLRGFLDSTIPMAGSIGDGIGDLIGDLIGDVIGDVIAGPLLRIRLHVLLCTNDDGLMTDGSPPRPLADIGAEITKIVAVTNDVFADTKIEFVFYPSADLEERQDPGLNYDWWLDPHDPRLWQSPALTDKEVALLAKDASDSFNRDPYRDTEALKYPAKLVLVVAEGQHFTRAQSDWRWCSSCQGLFRLDPEYGTAPSRCPSGAPHKDQGSGHYALFGVSDAQLGERGWQMCAKCRGLFFTAGGSGSCPAGGPHVAASGSKYTLLRDRPDKPGEANWRLCKNCQGNFLATYPNSLCPAGGTHLQAGNANYTITIHDLGPWLMGTPRGGWYSGIDREFVTPSPWGQGPDLQYLGEVLAHEIGHYLNLAHTHGDFDVLPDDAPLPDKPTAKDLLQVIQDTLLDALLTKIAGGTPADVAVQELVDYDFNHGVEDTPGDPGEDAMHWLNAANGTGDKCGKLGEFKFQISTAGTSAEVLIKPDRANVMSYYSCSGEKKTFSSDQKTRMRQALLKGKRRRLVDVQLGVTAAPTELRTVVWGPLNYPQKIVLGYKEEDFDKLNAELGLSGLQLRVQQGYLSQDGQEVLWDGLFEQWQANHQAVWGWSIDDFPSVWEQHFKAGLRLTHLQSYLLPGGEERVNALWHTGDGAEWYALGYTDADLHAYVAEAAGQGLGIVHVSGWNLPHGELRFDAILRGGTTDHVLMTGWAIEDLIEEYDKRWADGFKLAMLDTCVADGGVRYNGIWRPNPEPQVVAWQMTREQVLADTEEMWQQGMGPISIATLRFA